MEYLANTITIEELKHIRVYYGSAKDAANAVMPAPIEAKMNRASEQCAGLLLPPER